MPVSRGSQQKGVQGAGRKVKKVILTLDEGPKKREERKKPVVVIQQGDCGGGKINGEKESLQCIRIIGGQKSGRFLARQIYCSSTDLTLIGRAEGEGRKLAWQRKGHAAIKKPLITIEQTRETGRRDHTKNIPNETRQEKQNGGQENQAKNTLL